MEVALFSLKDVNEHISLLLESVELIRKEALLPEGLDLGIGVTPET
jgi:hypothetical protein